MGLHQRKDKGNDRWCIGLLMVEGVARFRCGLAVMVRSRAQKPLLGFLDASIVLSPRNRTTPVGQRVCGVKKGVRNDTQEASRWHRPKPV